MTILTKYGLQLDRTVVEPAQDDQFLDLVKQWVRIEGDHDDFLLRTLVDSAFRHLDGVGGMLGRCLIFSEFVVEQSVYRKDSISLSFPPINTVSSIEYVDDNGNRVIVDGYRLRYINQTEMNAVVEFFEPITSDNLKITYVAGMCAKPSALGGNFKTAVLTLIAHFYDTRDTGLPTGPAWDGLIGQLRLVSI